MTSGTSVDLITLAAEVKKVSGTDADILVCRPGLGNEYTADNSLLRQELVNFEFTSHSDGINDLFQYYRTIEASIDLMKLLYQ